MCRVIVHRPFGWFRPISISGSSPSNRSVEQFRCGPAGGAATRGDARLRYVNSRSLLFANGISKCFFVFMFELLKSGIGPRLFCNRKFRQPSKEATLMSRKRFLKLIAVLDNLKCLDEVSGQRRGEAAGAGPPINFLFAAFKIRAPIKRSRGPISV